MKKGDVARLPALESELETVELFVRHFRFYVELFPLLVVVTVRFLATGHVGSH